MSNTKVEFNDTPELRGFASENFTWVLDKETGVSCSWGRNAKENPNFDEISPEIINWKISNFELKTYIKYFNFLTNIKIKNEEENTAIFCEEIDYNKLLKIKDKLICMSTFGSILLEFSQNDILNNKKDITKFLNYIKLFNVSPKLIIQYKENIDNTFIKNLSKLTNRFILKIKNEFFDYKQVIELTEKLKTKDSIINIELNINNNNYGQAKNLLENINVNIPIILNFNFEPFITLEKYLKIQKFCEEKGLINVFMSQCSKKHFSKRVIGTILHEIDCPATRFSIYLEDNLVYPCEFNKKTKFNLDTIKTIYDFWNSNDFSIIKNNLSFNGMCNNNKK